MERMALSRNIQDSLPERRLARHAARLAWSDVPATTRDRFRMLVLDYVACLLSGLRSPLCDSIAGRALRTGGRAEASIVGVENRVPLAAAAFANAVAAHIYEADDVHDPGALHLSAVIFPVVFAAAEARGAAEDGWERVGAAALAALDVAGRIGETLTPWMQSGWMPTGIACTVGAAAGAARILGLDEHGVASAMGLAAAGGGLLRQPLVDKVTGKSVLCAQAATRACEAAELARAGIQGAQLFLSGSFGLGRTFAARCPDLRWRLDDLGERFAVDELSFKPYPCCRAAHPAIGIALSLKEQHGFEADDVTKVDIRVPKPMFEMCGAPFSPGDTPRVSAQFSIPYTVAVALLKGAPRFGDFEDDVVLASEEVQDLAAKVETVGYETSPGRPYLGEPVNIRVQLKDGRIIEDSDTRVAGAPNWPMTDAARRAKLEDAADGALAPENLDRLQETIASLPAGHLSDVMDLLRNARGRMQQKQKNID